MPYEVFAEKVKVLPPHYYAELMDYLEFLVAKSQMQERKESDQNTDENRKRAFDILKKYKASLPEDFDADKELEIVMGEKYGFVR